LREVEKSGAEHPGGEGREGVALGAFTLFVGSKEIDGLCQDVPEYVRSFGKRCIPGGKRF
jgi:hypothetical protein